MLANHDVHQSFIVTNVSIIATRIMDHTDLVLEGQFSFLLF